MNLFLDLFLTFAKIGLFTFGGGYAMIALIENTCVEKKRHQLRNLRWVQAERHCWSTDCNDRNDPSLFLHHLCDIEVFGSFS